MEKTCGEVWSDRAEGYRRCVVSSLTSENIPSPNHSTRRFPGGTHLLFQAMTKPGHAEKPFSFPHTISPAGKPFPSCRRATTTHRSLLRHIHSMHFDHAHLFKTFFLDVKIEWEIQSYILA